MPGPAWVGVAAALALALLLVLVSGGFHLLSGRAGRWLLTQAIHSRLFVVCGLVVLGSALAIGAICGALWLAGDSHRKRKAAGAEGGGAIVEFVLVLPLMLLFSMVMGQCSFLMGGHICVQYAAFCAARSAIVVVPSAMGDEGPGKLAGLSDAVASGKLSRIKAAAVYAVMPISCSNGDYPKSNQAAVLQRSLVSFYGQYGWRVPNWVGNFLQQKYQYAMDYTHVSLDGPQAPAPEVTDIKFRPYSREDIYAYHMRPQDRHAACFQPEDITVHVKHTFYLSFPVANKVISTFAGGVQLPLGHSDYGILMNANCTLTNEGRQDFVETEQFQP